MAGPAAPGSISAEVGSFAPQAGRNDARDTMSAVAPSSSYRHPPSLLLRALSPANLRRAARRVAANRGAPGIDGMTCAQLPGWLERHGPSLRTALFQGRYRPAPLRQVLIPKPDGGQRVLGIPTVRDRCLQQAVLQILGRQLEPEFSPGSFGYRQGRGPLAAVQRARVLLSGEPKLALHLDIEKFFDRVDHRLLLAALAARVPEAAFLLLVARWLRAPFLCPLQSLPGPPQRRSRPRLAARTAGVPQGGPLSPLLANLYLDRFDRHLAACGFGFCRYADDVLVVLSSATDAADGVVAEIDDWLAANLRLRLNRTKCRLSPAREAEFLGYSFRDAPAGGVTPADGAWRRLQDRCLLSIETTPLDDDTHMLGQLRPLLRGWRNYFRLASEARRGCSPVCAGVSGAGGRVRSCVPPDSGRAASTRNGREP